MGEIGSEFELPDIPLLGARAGNGLWRGGGDFLSSGRDALCRTIQHLGLRPGDRVLLPAYLCEEVAAPFLTHGLKPVFYRLRRGLEVDRADIQDKLCAQTKALLYIHYFGFPQAPLADIRKSAPEIRLIEDCSQAFLSERQGRPLGEEGDVSVASLRKLLPVPDGGIFRANRRGEADLPGLRRSAGHLLFLGCRWSAAALKRTWLTRPLFPKSLFLRLFAHSEALLSAYPKPAAMSRLSRRLLGRLDLDGAVRARRRNYARLLFGLRNRDAVRPLFPGLPEGVCPLGFPVLAADRERLKRTLIDARIYPPVHWRLPAMVRRSDFPAEWFVSEHILTVPIDQRYDENDMDRILTVLNAYRGESLTWPIGA